MLGNKNLFNRPFCIESCGFWMIVGKSSIKLDQAISNLAKELRSRSLRIESAADRVLAWSRRTRAEEPNRYNELHAKESRVLRAAGVMIYRRSMKNILQKSRPGSGIRIRAVGSHIYNMERWVLPVLETVSPQTYKSALYRLVGNEIPEYSSWHDEFDRADYVPKSILRVFIRARKLGILPPKEVTSKCERALSTQPTVREMFGTLENLTEGYWDRELSSTILTRWGDRRLSDSIFHDDVLMKSTKLPERRIKEWLKEKRGLPSSQLKISGGRLLPLARQEGFFTNSEGENGALLDLLQGYFKIRNYAHHENLGGTRATLDTILLTNKILNMIEDQTNLSKNNLAAS